REFNFAEATFVLPPRDPRHAARMRIFTPKAELPFAGHPTIGTAAVLIHRGLKKKSFVLEEGIGPIPIEVADNGLVRERRGAVLLPALERQGRGRSRRMAAAARGCVVTEPVRLLWREGSLRA